MSGWEPELLFHQSSLDAFSPTWQDSALTGSHAAWRRRVGREAKTVVRLSIDERFQLEAIVANPKSAQDRALRARILIKTDADGPAWPDARIAEALEVSVSTVMRLRERCVFECKASELAGARNQ